jgi:dTDP-4-amino-4,6-dideoxygalactose transaminase
MDWKVTLSDLEIGAEEEAAVLRVLRSKWLTMGAETQAFEGEFAGFHGTQHAIAVSNCTQALHLACVALGIGPGDEVIIPSLTFVATSNAVLYTGADVVFADILSAREPTIDPAAIEVSISPRTKAIIVMHYGGYPCRMPEINTLERRHGLKLIEDSAHAPGAWLDGRALGTWGDIGCYSFFSNKNLATGEGGMLVTDSADLAERQRLLRSHGMTSLTWDRHKGHAYSYDVVDLGYNDRIDEMRSALGRVQLSKLAANNARRLEIIAGYVAALQPTGLEVPFGQFTAGRSRSGEDRSYLPAGHLMTVLLPHAGDRSRFVAELSGAGVQTSLHYPPVHTFSYYGAKYQSVALPATEDYARREVTLPLYPSMTAWQQEYVIDQVQMAMRRL